MREVNLIIIHESDTPTGRHTTVEDIDSWHVANGWHRNESDRLAFNPGLKAIGYHWVVYIDGSVHSGRNISEVGSHCAGLNSKSVGICLVGKGVYNQLQWDALESLVKLLQITYSGARILGHYETPTGAAQGKTCPDFAVPHWVANGFTPQQQNIA